jgi:hypothetical protein
MTQDKSKYDLNEVMQLLNDSEIDYKNEVARKDRIPVVYKQMRKGIFLFLFFHLMIEIIITRYYPFNAKFIGLNLIVNYLVSRIIIRYKSKRIKHNENTHFFYFGFFISFIVLLIRLIIGYMISVQ